MPSSADLSIYQGDDWTAIVTVLNEDGTPADISTFTAKAQIRRSIADSDPVVVVEITTVVASPLVNLSIPHTVTATLSGSYVWDLQLTGPSGGITTILKGRAKVEPEVTRATSIVLRRTA
jgi:hypothetical protein